MGTLPHTCTHSSGSQVCSLVRAASCSTSKHFVDSSLSLLLSGTAVPVTCLLVFVCLVSFVLFSQFLLVSPFLPVIDRLCLYTSVAHLSLGGCIVSVLRWLELFTRQGGWGIQSPTAFPSLLSQVVFQMSNPRFHSPAQLLFDGISSSLFILNGWDVVLEWSLHLCYRRALLGAVLLQNLLHLCRMCCPFFICGTFRAGGCNVLCRRETPVHSWLIYTWFEKHWKRTVVFPCSG